MQIEERIPVATGCLTKMYKIAKITKMNIINVTATELKNNASEILNKVGYQNKTIIIHKYNKPFAQITPLKPEKKAVPLNKALSRLAGSMPDFPDVTKDRVSRKKWPRL